MFTIYILKLQGGRYYIGKSTDPRKKYYEHIQGRASIWTQKYKPIGIEKLIASLSEFDEDIYVKEYMLKYGIDKVRGGTFESTYLSDYQLYILYHDIQFKKH